MKNSDHSPDNHITADKLTWREQEVFALLAERLTNREIASRLHLAESTVKDYVSIILGKLHVKNRRQAVEKGISLGFLEPARSSTDFTPSLPIESTPFVGRSEELETIAKQLKQTQLLTLLGPGGIGKTRLALKVASELTGDYKDGSIFVSLAPIRSVGHIVQTIAEAINFPLGTHEDPLVQLLRYLQKKQMLLVLDNFEHLLEGASIVSEILQAARDVRVLVTSREKLDLQSETSLTIGGMDFPDAENSEDALNSDAVALFLQNAQKANPAFVASLDDVKQIAEICQLVQGMPLAIDLASGWMHVLSISEIAQELQKGFDILSSEKRDTPQRHRSIRAICEHSWSLLDDREQNVVTYLSVFRGGFTLEAARQVAGAAPQVLSSLVNKSIILYRASSSRYEMHELLRQFMQEQLEEKLEKQFSAIKNHAEYFADFMERRWQYLRDKRQIPAFEEIEADLENVRTAWRYSLEAANLPHIQKFTNSFWLVLWIRGWYFAGAELFGDAAKALNEFKHPEAEVVRAVALANQGFFMTWLGLADQGYELANEGIQILENLDHPIELAFAYHNLTLPAYYLRRLPEEKEAADRMLKIARSLNDKWLLSLALFVSSVAVYREKNYPEAEELAKASLKESEELGDAILPILSKTTLGHLAIVNKDFKSAKQLFQQCLVEADKVGFNWAASSAIKYLGQVALQDNKIDEAEAHFLECLRIANDLGLERDIINHLYDLASLRVAQDRSTEAVCLLILILQQAASQQARLDGGQIKDAAKMLLTELEENVAPEIYAEAVEEGKSARLEETISSLLKQNP